jgi:AcrR family transcriptional regulator
LRSRQAILREAARLATLEGLEGLSIARLADAVGMSKSGLYAHFGSKQELQLATIELAKDVFFEQVVEPAKGVAGLERLRRLASGFLDYVERDVYPGGCFFASVAGELDALSMPVRNRAIDAIEGWVAMLEDAVRQAQADGVIDADEEPEQLAFEIQAYLALANTRYVIRRGPSPMARARKAMAARLAAAGAPPG